MTEQASQILDQSTKIGPNPCNFDLEYQFGHYNWYSSFRATRARIDGHRYIGTIVFGRYRRHQISLNIRDIDTV